MEQQQDDGLDHPSDNERLSEQELREIGHRPIGHGVTTPMKPEQRYYVALGRACDWLLRCKDCRSLVTSADIHKRGSCACGNRKFAEITMLSEREHADIVAGVIDFPHREDFLREFAACD